MDRIHEVDEHRPGPDGRLEQLAEQPDRLHHPLRFCPSTKTINANPITVTAGSTIIASNASFSGLTGPLSLQCAAAVNVGLFTAITVQPGSSFTPTQPPFHALLGSQMLQWIQSITFSQIGIQFNVTNSLPAGNPMTIVMTSNALGINGQIPIVLPFGQTSGQSTTATFANEFFLYPVPKTTPNLDFSVTLEPQSYNSATGQMTLFNITPGSSLSIGGNATVIDTWTQAVVSSPLRGLRRHLPQRRVQGRLKLPGQLLGVRPDLLIGSRQPLCERLAGSHDDGTDHRPIHRYRRTLHAARQHDSYDDVERRPLLPLGLGFQYDARDAAYGQRALEDLQIPNAKPSDLTLNYNLNIGTVTVRQPMPTRRRTRPSRRTW